MQLIRLFQILYCRGDGRCFGEEHHSARSSCQAMIDAVFFDALINMELSSYEAVGWHRSWSGLSNRPGRRAPTPTAAPTRRILSLGCQLPSSKG